MASSIARSRTGEARGQCPDRTIRRQWLGRLEFRGDSPPPRRRIPRRTPPQAARPDHRNRSLRPAPPAKERAPRPGRISLGICNPVFLPSSRSRRPADPWQTAVQHSVLAFVLKTPDSTPCPSSDPLLGPGPTFWQTPRTPPRVGLRTRWWRTGLRAFPRPASRLQDPPDTERARCRGRRSDRWASSSLERAPRLPGSPR